jgi:hypothetical protein
MFKQFKYVFALFLFLSSCVLYAQERYLSWIDPQTISRFKINIDTYELLKEGDSGLWFKAGKIKLDSAIFNHVPSKFINNYFIFDDGNRIRFTIDGTGHVYEYLKFKKELIRIDNTFHSGYNYKSNKFIRNGLIYSLGGVGFWKYNSSITYFDEKLKEWELLRPKNKGPISVVGGYQGYDKKLDTYFSGAFYINKYIYGDNEEFLDNLYQFDFKKNSWFLLGKLNPDLPFLKSSKIIWTGEQFFEFYAHKIYVINPQTNVVKVFEDSDKPFVFRDDYFINGDTIVAHVEPSGGSILKISISEINQKATYWGRFYYSGTNVYWYYLSVILLIGVSTFFILRYKQTQINKNLNFTETERKLLKTLLSLKADEYLTTQDINTILDAEDKSQENQRRIRFNVITQLNNKLKFKLACEKGIDRRSLPEDKRLMIYVLDPQISAELKKLLS